MINMIKKMIALNSYGYNNPVKYVDPTGLCGAEATLETNQPPTFGYISLISLVNQCFQLKGTIESLYQISISGVWTFEEMDIVKDAMGDISNGLGGAGNTSAILGGTQLMRDRTLDTMLIHSQSTAWKQVANIICNTITFGLIEEQDYRFPVVAVAGGNGITFFNDAFSRGRDWGRWTVIHEMGHVYDSKAPLWYWGDASLDPAHRFVSPSGRIYLYRPADESSNTVSIYAGGSETEEFAENWAATLFRGSWSAMATYGRFPASPDMQAFIRREIDAFKAAVGQ
jgi:hypothetical protein